MSVLVCDDNGYRSTDRYGHNKPERNRKFTSPENLTAFLESSGSEEESNLSDTVTEISQDLECESDDSIQLIGEARNIVRRRIIGEETVLSVSQNSVEIIEEGEDSLRTPDKVPKRKRSKSDSSIEDDSFRSPEIPFTGSPVIYQLYETNNTKIIIKKSMSVKKPEPRTKKFSEKDITSMLDSDNDEEIFDRPKRNTEGVGTPKEPPRTAARIADANTPRNSPRTRGKTQETPTKDEVSLRMKFRRSTEQSNYKVEPLETDSLERRASLRTSIVLPKRFTDTGLENTPGRRTPTRYKKPVQYYEEPSDLDDSIKTPKRSTKLGDAKSGRRTPSRNTKPVQYCEESPDLKDPMGTPKRVSRQAKTPKRDPPQDEISTPKSRSNHPKTPRSSILKSVPMTPSGRPRRSTRAPLHVDMDEDEGNENDTNKGNTDESDNEILPRRTFDRKRRLLPQESPMTPRKSVTIVEEAKTPKKSVTEEGRTPRRARRPSSSEDEPTTPKRVSRLASLTEESVTPKQRGRAKLQTPSLKHGALTPSMHQRSANVGKPKTALQEARAQLHVSAVPKSLPCREEEFNDIFTFLQRKLLDHSSGCIYISGVPGTGKTATVNEVIRCLRKLVSKGELEEFNFLEINGMKLTEPRQAYVQILKQLSGQSLTWEQAYQNLEKRFTKSMGHRGMTLLLVDELDLLCNKRQDVVYNLLDWPGKQGAQLVVLTIANTMDLPERVLMGRVTSRLGLTRLTFQPYNHKQLQEIVTTRLKDSDAFRSEAIQLVARKVAAVSGDARRALDICRRATEIAESNGGKIVSMQDVNEALTEMIASAKVQAIKHCSEMEKVFLQAVCAEISRTGVEEAVFQNVYKQLEALCSFEGVKTPNISQSLEICSMLSANRLLLCEHSRMDIMQRILLNVSADDIHFALQSVQI
ncbi:origin recognition complex subunit 1 [Diachasma alloeum]|uniref:origin recognition complex subunit 1 n=1 Tax=Diachasma alloeum TaxID=454923 RepID=UPI0007383112|nr:origin recognition complex subunit 1 [Diachasma alloeum]XP_015116111.1 origin recognition complex subunit 1 [Diachasma alloeum]XP_015116112.1 origin recognition complex subunit 1 [Diachasma alloeum]